METVRVIYHHEADGWWADSPDVEGWSAAGDTYLEVAKLAREGVPFALGHDAELEHYVPAGEHVAAQKADIDPMDERQQERGERFRTLHKGDPFLIPNPWDAGSARVMEALGFEALATTSSGFAFTLGRPDGGATLDQLVGHVGVMAGATRLPLSVDLENGHGTTPDDVATAIERVAEAGAVGCSIEDFDPRGHLYELAEARERIAAAVEVARRLPFPFTLTARAENHIRGNPDLDDTIARLLAYQEEGADVLFAPGLRESVEIRSICEAVERPVNVLGHSGLSVSEITDAGAQRISVGGALAWTAIEAMVDAAEAMRDSGDLSGLSRPGRIREWI